MLKQRETLKSKQVTEDEVISFCPNCKEWETIWLKGSVLVPTRKFSQEDGRIYHDCNSNEPCRLFRTY